MYKSGGPAPPAHFLFTINPPSLMKSICFSALLSVLIFSFVGCSNYVPMKGKVTFSDDGSPLTEGTVFFESPTFVSRGSLLEDGTFTMGSFKKNDGLPLGTYRVYIGGATIWVVTNEATGDGYDLPIIEDKYTSMSKSGLSIEVDGKTKTFDIVVEKHPRYVKYLEKSASKP